MLTILVLDRGWALVLKDWDRPKNVTTGQLHLLLERTESMDRTRAVSQRHCRSAKTFENG